MIRQDKDDELKNYNPTYEECCGVKIYSGKGNFIRGKKSHICKVAVLNLVDILEAKNKNDTIDIETLTKLLERCIEIVLQ